MRAQLKSIARRHWRFRRWTVIPFVVAPSGLAQEEPRLLEAPVEDTLLFAEIIFPLAAVVLFVLALVAYVRQRRVLRTLEAQTEALRRSEAALAKSESLVRRMQSMAQIGGWEYAPETHDLVWTEEIFDIFELPPAAAPPAFEQVLAYYPEDARSELQAIMRRVRETGEPFDVEVPMKTAKGRPIWVRAQGTIAEGGGPPLRLVGTLQNITARKNAEIERRRLESQIQQAQKLESLGVLAGGIAHDFNNLLVGILGNADLALMDLAPESPARQSVSQIESAARRASELSRQMLAYSGKGTFIVQPLNLSRLVEEMAHLLHVSISKRAVLKLNLADQLPVIEGDPSQIRQIVMNLATNGSDALGEKSGVISISTGVMRCDAGYLQSTYLDEELPEGIYAFLEVSDTGTGMDAETVQRIFDPFFTTKFTGRGLGLAAVLGIIRSHRAAVKVYSEPGKGSSFKALFPVADGLDRMGDGAAAGGTWQGHGIILVVDDEETVRVFVQRVLERLGFSVLLAADGREGIEVFKRHEAEISLVLLDMTMPHMNGEETFRALRQIKRDISVILTSGYNEQEATDRFAGKGLAGFLQKPYQIAELRAMLQRILGG